MTPSGLIRAGVGIDDRAPQCFAENMRSLRFNNPAMQSQLALGLEQLALGSLVKSDGWVICEDSQWSEVNAIAHAVRNGCFKWYFSWFKDAELAEQFKSYLKANGLRFELEEHRDADDYRLVFLLPWEDREKHKCAGQPPSTDTCSFCGKKWFEVEHFTTSASAAICGECVSDIHQAMRTE